MGSPKENKKPQLLLFDIDGTLTDPRKTITEDMLQFLKTLQTRDDNILAIVGGSDFGKAREQLGHEILDLFEYVFSENGLVHYRSGQLVHERCLLDFIPQPTLNKFINHVLGLFSTLDIPVKTGTFIEYRKSMLNISPIGRNCSQSQRDEFEKYDHEHQIRARLIQNLKENFPDLPVDYGIGGQISFDVFPRGLNKTYCLDYLPLDDVDVHFFGDKTDPGGNDYEIFIDPRVYGHRVTSYKDTQQQVESLICE
jgi:phosphomannomutase